MKFITLTIAALLTATTINAAELGGGFSAGATLEAEYNFDTEAESITATPYVGYNLWGINWGVETELDMQNLSDEELDLEWSMRYPFLDNAEAYLKVETNEDFDTDDLTVGASFKF